MSLIAFFDFAGTFVFAISGAIAAMEKKLDIFGTFVIALVTAVGGGTLRDLLIGKQPVVWLINPWYIVLIAAAVPLSFIFKGVFQRMRKSMFLFDSMGIGLFTIFGLEKTLNAGLSPLAAVMMGSVSAVFGGVVRDILCNEIPIIFRKEIYATACIAGGMLYLLLENLIDYRSFNMILTVCFVTIIRILAVTRKWRLQFH